MADSPDATEFACRIVDAFRAYNDDFGAITRQAKQRFETRNWIAGQADAAERIDLYDKSVNRAVHVLKRDLGDCSFDKALWHQIRDAYAREITEFADSEFYKTFFSSITRRIFTTIGVDENVEFVALDVEHDAARAGWANLRTYSNRGELGFLIDELLSDYAFAVPYRDIDTTIQFVSAEIEAYVLACHDSSKVLKVEALEAIFYRSTRAYIVGRMEGRDWTAPLVIALKNSDEGILADAVILSDNDVGMLFGITRSYFHVDLETVGAAVSFLKSLMPRKAIAEIYTVLGRAKQGKTEQYRSLMRHLEEAPDQFIRAPGDKGMVMEVFTLRSYNVVFKVIRDHFAWPKSISRRGVMDKYKLVFRRDRAGRLIDAQEFRRLRFPKDTFEQALLDDLLSECGQTCRIENGDVVIEHVYLERCLRPLNLYLREVDEKQEIQAAIDYGQAIRDLARSNIFAGDLLLKNFGVTRHGRVIFYDYDELCLVTECNFRKIPTPRDDMEEMYADAWFYVGPNDIFPEQFINFLGFSEAAKAVFMKHHADLLDADFWNGIKRAHESGGFLEVLPYSAKLWTEHRGGLIVPSISES